MTGWWREPTRGQWMAFSAAWLGWVLDAFDFTIYLLVLPLIAEEFDVSLTATAGSITLTLLLRLLGGYAAGAVADRWGRKLPLMISMVWFAVCDGAIAFAPSFFWVLVLRTLFGFGMGAEWTSGTTLAMESWPARSRGIASGILQGSWAIGYFLAALVAGWVVPIWGWRALFLIAALPALLAVPIRFLVPESLTRAPKDRPPPLRALLDPAIRSKLVWACLAMLFGLAEYYALSGLYPTLLTRELGFSAVAMTHHVMLFNAGMLAGAVVCGLAAARWGPIPSAVVPATLMIFLLPVYTGMTGVSTYAGAVLGGMFGAGFAGVTPLLLTSLFPAPVRARCVGIAYHVGAFGSAFVAPTVTAMRERGGMTLAWSLLLVAGVSLAAMVVVLLLRPAGVPFIVEKKS
jgi:SHS family lactate transporter-like MFS transporter